jgi:cytoskeletal protein CcmA (bactofilin family)
MAPKGKIEPVSGFHVVRAVKQVRDHQGSAPPPPPKPPRAPPEKPPDQPDDGKSKSARIGKTAVPTKYEYECHKCGYQFTIAGKVQTLYCAKCRTILNQADYTIDKHHDVSIVTAGVVKIGPEGVWAGGDLLARDVVIEGRHEGGTIKSMRRLEVCPGAQVQLDYIQAKDLLVRAGAELALGSEREFRDVEIAGTIDGALNASGLVTIHAGGHFKGKLVTKHLVVEDGGGLTAEVKIGGSDND